MQPRIVFGTHYQVDEPAYMEFLVKRCTSPVQSTYREVVEQKFAQEVRARGQDFNTPAGRYAVDLARGLGLITPNNIWTDKGHLVNLIAEVDSGQEFEEQLVLTLPERLLHFRVFLEADGAALLFLARRLIQRGALVNPDTTWNLVAQEMFVEAYSDYLVITNNTADRVKLRREIDRIKNKGYEGNSGSHKSFIHMQTLCRLGLVTRVNSGGSRVYRLPEHPAGIQTGLVTLVDQIPNALALEKVINDHKPIEVAASVLQIAFSHYLEDGVAPGAESLLPMLIAYYQQIMSTGAPLCSLSTVIEAMQIDLLARKSQLLPYDAAVQSIVVAQKQHPKEIRFHVDRRGQPAFLKLSDDFLREYSEEKSSL